MPKRVRQAKGAKRAKGGFSFGSIFRGIRDAVGKVGDVARTVSNVGNVLKHIPVVGAPIGQVAAIADKGASLVGKGKRRRVKAGSMFSNASVEAMKKRSWDAATRSQGGSQQPKVVRRVIASGRATHSDPLPKRQLLSV